jgi:membrane-bound lytic murein transglycosylase D
LVSFIERVSFSLALAVLLPAVAGAATVHAGGPELTVTAAGYFDQYQGAVERLQSWFFDDEDANEETGDVSVMVVAEPSRLAFESTPEVDKFVTFYTSGRGRVTARVGLSRSAEYRAMAERIFVEEGLPIDLVWLAQVESNWIVNAESPARAKGLWQLIPETGERFGLECQGASDERIDVEKSTRAAAKYLKWLGKRYDGDWLLAMGAYNCGEGGMDRAIERAGSRNFWAIARAGALPNETANYVPAILATIRIAEAPARFGLA